MKTKVNITDILIGLIVIVATGFLVAYFYGWHQNAINGTKYDLPNLMETAKLIISQLIALFSGHSLLNTSIPWLQRPENKEGEKQ